MDFFIQAGVALLLCVVPLILTFTRAVPSWPYRLDGILLMTGLYLAIHCYNRVLRAKNTPRLHLATASTALALCLLSVTILLMVHPG